MMALHLVLGADAGSSRCNSEYEKIMYGKLVNQEREENPEKSHCATIARDMGTNPSTVRRSKGNRSTGPLSAEK